MPVVQHRELNHSQYVILPVPHGERAIVRTSLEFMFRGRSPFLTKICSTSQDITANIIINTGRC